MFFKKTKIDNTHIRLLAKRNTQKLLNIRNKEVYNTKVFVNIKNIKTRYKQLVSIYLKTWMKTICHLKNNFPKPGLKLHQDGRAFVHDTAQCLFIWLLYHEK